MNDSLSSPPVTASELPDKHPLADYVRILARGKNASRSMTREEALFTMEQLLSDDCRPEQLGAILMLLRVKEETAEELAGFAAAIDQNWPQDSINVDLVWPSYAGKRRQPFWCLLSALLLEQLGYKVLFHGSLAHTEGRVYLHEVFSQLGLTEFNTTADLLRQADRGMPAISYLPCQALNPKLQDWLGLKAILGVRSPINTVLKTIAPCGIPSVQGIFHPNYANIHVGAAELNASDMLVIKGEGGEFEVNPERTCQAQYHLNGTRGELVLPNEQSHYADKPAGISTQLLLDCWQGKLESEYAREAVIRTTALALVAIRKQPEQLHTYLEESRQAWAQRDLSRLG